MMRRRLFASMMIAVVTAAALFACIDLTPIELSSEPADTSVPDVIDLDATDSAADANLHSACALCLVRDAGPCVSSLANCEADPQCVAIYECATAAGCLALASVQAVVGCGIPCAEDAGLKSQFDPPGVEILALLLCGQKACSGVCPWANDP